MAASTGVLAAIMLPAFVNAGSAHAEFDPAMRMSWVQPVMLTEETSAPPGLPLAAVIDLSDQTMNVYLGDKLVETFKVSSGRQGYGTPPGHYQPEWLAAKWRSRKYHYAPMPWSVFFHGGYAIHGTTEVRHLGRPASHGCIRLHPDNAHAFYTLVQKIGRDNTTITIVR